MAPLKKYIKFIHYFCYIKGDKDLWLVIFPQPLYCTVLCCTVLCCAVLYCTVLYCTVLYCTVLYCTVLYCTVLYCTVLYCTVLYCTVLYCTVLYCTVLFCTVALFLIFIPSTVSIEQILNTTFTVVRNIKQKVIIIYRHLIT